LFSLSKERMRHVGYTRETAVKPEPPGTAEDDAAKAQ
jgi:hypothetical protein